MVGWHGSRLQREYSFTTHEGLYEISVMSFGLCNALATFQRLVEVTLHGLARCKCVVYLDNILLIWKSLSRKPEGNIGQIATHHADAEAKEVPFGKTRSQLLGICSVT